MKLTSFLLTFFWICRLALADGGQEKLELDTPTGTLVGLTNYVLGTRINSFLGVPFGSVPRRFAPPEPVKRWLGPMDATTLAKACYQDRDTAYPTWGAEMWNANTPITEDCLSLNVWTPYEGKDLPVLVWLFGGGFWYGSPSLTLYYGGVLASVGKAVVVNINYRVGPFGFLYFGTEDVPGNMALLDQQLALRWLQEHVQHFGGDPTKVTLFGESAGAASIVAHLLSPNSVGLFSGGILQSGSLDNRWAMDRPERAYEKSMELAKSVGCASNHMRPNLVVECLRSLPAAKVSSAQWNIKVSLMEFPLTIVSQDRNFFLCKDAFESLRKLDFSSKHVNIIVGINRDEGSFWNIYYLSQFYPWNSGTLPRMNGSSFLNCIDAMFDYHDLRTRRAAAFLYWDRRRTNCAQSSNDQSSKQDHFYSSQMSQMVGDYHFTCDSVWLVNQLANRTAQQKRNSSAPSVFVYYFTQRSSTNPWPKWGGVMHGYEIEYVYGVPLINNSEYTAGEKKLSEAMMKYWATFAKTGIPHGKVAWPEYRTDDQKWLRLDGGKIEAIDARKEHECRFWRSVKDAEFAKMRKVQICSSAATGAIISANFVFAFVIALVY